MIATSIEQSKNLLKLGLKATTADMHYFRENGPGYALSLVPYRIFHLGPGGGGGVNPNGAIPVWSLSALEDLTKVCQRYERSLRVDKRWNVFAVCGDDVFRSFDINPQGYKTPFDAVYALVIWLLENHKEL